MRGQTLPLPLRSVVVCGVTAAHAALFTMMASPSLRPPEAKGGAPAINLTLAPSPQFDDPASGVETASSAQLEPVNAARPFRSPHRPVLTPLTLDTVPLDTASPTPTPPAPSAPRVTVEEGRTTQPASTPSTAPSSTAGRTSGGGASSLGAAARSEEDVYAARVIAWVEAHKGRGPGRVTGVTTLRFVLDRRGRVRESVVVVSSGDRGLDGVALDAIRSAPPFPRPPAAAAWQTREFHVRLDYRRRT